MHRSLKQSVHCTSTCVLKNAIYKKVLHQGKMIHKSKLIPKVLGVFFIKTASK
jgi:hypothetical protein